MSDTFKLSKPGTVFKPETGKLYLFQGGSIQVLAAWPRMVAWKKTSKHPYWVHFRPKISVPPNVEDQIRRLGTCADEHGQLVLPICVPPEHLKANRAELAWLSWYAAIPPEIRTIVGRFAPRDRQFHLLSLIARCGAPALDLAISNASIFYALASSWVFHRPPVAQPMRSARALLQAGKKQRDILHWLEFESSESVRRILSRVVHKAVTIESLLYLRSSMRDTYAKKALRHSPRINRGLIRIVTDPALLIASTPSLLEEIGHRRDEDSRAKAAYLLRDALDMHRLLFPNARRVHPLLNMASLQEMHDALVNDLNRARILQSDVAFPPPPIPGTETIIPIVDVQSLVSEGIEMHNCVASYLHRVVVQQRTYIYRVILPGERCTLSISLRGNRWLVSELRRAFNHPASEVAWKTVREWLQDKGAYAKGEAIHEEHIDDFLFGANAEALGDPDEDGTPF